MQILLLPLFFLFGCFANNPPPIELKGYFRCQESLIKETDDALVCYARTQRDCRQGNIIMAFEKRQSQRAGRAIFQIVDTVHVKVHAPAQELSITTCTTANGNTRQYFVLFKPDASRAKYLRKIERIWGPNAQGKLVQVPSRMVKCLNEDFGAD